MCFKTPFFILFFIFFVATYSQAQPSLEFVKELFTQGEFYRTISESKKSIFNYPEDSSVQHLKLYIAQSLYRLGKYKESYEYSISILKNDTLPFNSDKVRVLTSLNLLQMNKEEDSLRIWNDLQKVDQLPFPQTFQVKQIDKNNAVTINHFIPGAGFLYAEEYDKAFVSFLLNLSFIYAAYTNYIDQSYGITALLLFFEIGWYEGGNRAVAESIDRINLQRLNLHRQNWIDSVERGWEL